MFWFSVPCIRSHKSAGHFIVNFVTAQMVGDRRFPGATILGGEVLYLFRQPSRFSPADWFRTTRCLVVWTVYNTAGPARSDGALSLSGLFWDFGSLYQRRRGVVSYALSRQPSSSSTSLRRLWLGVAAQASGTLLSDVSASPNVEASRITRGRATATSTLFYMQGSGCEINASHTQGSGCEINASHTISRRQLVMDRPRASRSSSHRDERWEGCRV